MRHLNFRLNDTDQRKVRRSAKLTWQDVLHSETNHCWYRKLLTLSGNNCVQFNDQIIWNMYVKNSRNRIPSWSTTSTTLQSMMKGAKNSWNVPDSINFQFAKGFRAIFHYMEKLFNQDVKALGKKISFETHWWQEKLHYCKS